jgi:hypothetical protein
MTVTQRSATLQVRIMGPNYVPGSKKDLYVKVRLQWQCDRRARSITMCS